LRRDEHANMPLLYLAGRRDVDIHTSEKGGEVTGVLAYWRQGPELGNRVHVMAVDSEACKELLERVREPGLRCTVQAQYADVAKQVLDTDGLIKQELVAQSVSDYEPKQRTRAYRSLTDDEILMADRLFHHHPDYARRMALIRSTRENPAVFSFEDDGAASFINVNMELNKIFRLYNLFTHPEKRNRGHATSTAHGITKYLFEESGASEVFVYVAEQNIPALEAFRKVGFVPRDKYFESPVAEWMLHS